MATIPPWQHAERLDMDSMQQLRLAACLAASPPLTTTPAQHPDLNAYALAGVLELLRRGMTGEEIRAVGQTAIDADRARADAWEAARTHALEWWLTAEGTEYLAMLDAGIHLAGKPWWVIEERWGWHPDALTASAQLAAYWWLVRQDELTRRMNGSSDGVATHEDLRYLLSMPYTVRDELSIAALRTSTPTRRSSGPIRSFETELGRAIQEGLLK